MSVAPATVAVASVSLRAQRAQHFFREADAFVSRLDDVRHQAGKVPAIELEVLAVLLRPFAIFFGPVAIYFGALHGLPHEERQLFPVGIHVPAVLFGPVAIYVRPFAILFGPPAILLGAPAVCFSPPPILDGSLQIEADILRKAPRPLRGPLIFRSRHVVHHNTVCADGPKSRRKNVGIYDF